MRQNTKEANLIIENIKKQVLSWVKDADTAIKNSDNQSRVIMLKSRSLNSRLDNALKR